MNAVLALLAVVLVILVLGALLARFEREARASAAGSGRDSVVAAVNALLPQTQCAQCGYPGCRPYAEAVVDGEAGIDQCPPGGEATIESLALLLGRDAVPLDTRYGTSKPPQLALIDEANCIGCALCLPACPVDAILGAHHFMHTVIEADCTGCELCLAPCPTDCISLVPRPATLADWRWPKPRTSAVDERSTLAVANDAMDGVRVSRGSDTAVSSGNRPANDSGGSTLPRVWRGGLALARDKPGLDTPIVVLSPGTELVFPLLGHGAHELEPRVHRGQRVERGDSLAAGVLASAPGTVAAIVPRAVPHPSGRVAPCVVLHVDEEAANAPLDDGPVLPPLVSLDLERLNTAGVGGLGGAGFLLYNKLGPCSSAAGLHTLIVNACECEPGIACDEALMIESSLDILDGCHTLARLLDCRRIVLVIEADKDSAVDALQRAATPTGRAVEQTNGQRTVASPARGNPAGETALEIRKIPPIYPSGAERLTVLAATGIRLPAGIRPVERGLLCVNVATVMAAGRARRGHAQLSRVVTLGGARATRVGHYRVAFGTPVSHVLAATGQATLASDVRIRLGGPLSGFDITDPSVPVTATVNRIGIEAQRRTAAPQPCIRCAACSDVCPVGLMPQALLTHAIAADFRELDRHRLDSCLACGCCDLVCPSSIPLTDTFRHAQAVHRDALVREDAARQSAIRHDRQATRVALESSRASDPVAEALARAQSRRRSRER